MTPKSPFFQGGHLSKWQLALVIGTPVVIGIGYLYYKRRIGESGKLVIKDPLLQGKGDGESLLANGENAAIGSSGSLKSNKLGKHNGTESSTSHDENIPIDQVTDPQQAKSLGNAFFKKSMFDKAKECYDKAISLCPANETKDLSTFYQNRAAVNEHLGNYESVRNDCDKALECNPKYTKALHRRAKACEYLGDLKQSLEDITAVCILEAFQNQSSLLMADRVLKTLGKQHAQAAMQNKVMCDPSPGFVKTYLSSFMHDPVMNAVNDESLTENSVSEHGDGDTTVLYHKALKCIRNAEYSSSQEYCVEEMKDPNSVYYYEACLLRGTIHQMKGNHDEAFKDFNEVINNSSNVKLKVNALIKRATLYLQSEKLQECQDEFKLAVELDPNNPDIYHHRGQVFILMELLNEAYEDFSRAYSLNPTSSIACVQKCYGKYRVASSRGDTRMMEAALKSFDEAIAKYPRCTDCHSLYAQVSLEERNFEKADQLYSKVLQIDPNNANTYVHKGLVLLQSTGDIDGTVALLKKAMEVDDKCELAYETLGTIEVQRGNLDHAVELFDKAIDMVKGEIEMSHLFSLRDAAIAQQTVAKKLGIQVSNAFK